jgi:autotransporter-associated beta strand protein
MKSKYTCPITLESLPALLCVLLSTSSAWATDTYTWGGATSSDWTVVGNWKSTPVAPAGGIFDARLNVQNGAANPLVYNEVLGDTTFGNLSAGGRGLVIGVSGTGGEMRITGGTFSTFPTLSGPDLIGNASVGTLILDGGNFIGAQAGTSIGFGAGTGTLIISNGTADLQTLTMGSTRTSTLSLDGGTLSVSNIVLGSTVATHTNIYKFNGGILRAKGDCPVFFPTVITNTFCHVRDGGLILDSAGYQLSVDQAFNHSAISGDAAIDGGVTKNGPGTFSLRGANTYTGPTIVNEGILGVYVPMPSATLRVASGAGINFIPNKESTWFLPSLALTNASLGFDYGSSVSVIPVVAIQNLRVEGSVVVNVIGSGLPVGDLTLATYTQKTGTGTFVLGDIPFGSQATLEDTGSSLVMHVTTASVQDLLWTATTGTWKINGDVVWNNGTAAYTEYPSGLNDHVTFPNPGGASSVTISGVVRPQSIKVSNSSGIVDFSGDGTISGATGVSKTGAGALKISTANDFEGDVTISGSGSAVFALHAMALGSTVGQTIVNGPQNVLYLGDVNLGSRSAKVTGETITINGAGLSGVYGALCGGNMELGNEWAGPVIIGSSGARIGTTIGGNLTVSGDITDNGNNYQLFIRGNENSVITMSSSFCSYGQTRFLGEPSSLLKLGANNALSTGLFILGKGTFDLAGHDQKFSGLHEQSGPGIIMNSGNKSTLSIDVADSRSIQATIEGPIDLVKEGSGKQTLLANNHTYTGSTIINSGELAVTLPLSSPVLALSDGARLTVAVTNSTWASLTSMSATNGVINLNYGGVSGVPAPVFTPSLLNAEGTCVINIAGDGLTIGKITLIDYTTKAGSGSFTIGALPAGMQGTISDSGSSIDLTLANLESPVLSFVRKGKELEFSWTGSAKLQSQTNTLSVGLRTEWFDYPNGQASPIVVPIGTEAASVFFRLAPQ